MSVMMACWKRNDFNQQRCSQELTAFHKCVIAAQVSEKIHPISKWATSFSSWPSVCSESQLSVCRFCKNCKCWVFCLRDLERCLRFCIHDHLNILWGLHFHACSEDSDCISRLQQHPKRVNWKWKMFFLQKQMYTCLIKIKPSVNVMHTNRQSFIY